MATQTLNTRIALKSDTTANWAKSTLVLLKGEQAIEITESGAYKIKIGDGVKTFAELPYATMTPEEISALIGDGSVQNVTLASGTNNGTLKLTVDGTTTDNIAVKGLGSAAYTNTSAYATAAQGTLATNAVRKVVSGTANGTISVTTGTGAATDIAVKGLGSAAYKGAGASQGQVPVNGAALGSGARGRAGRTWVMVSSSETDGTTTSDPKTSTECYVSIAAAATKLHNQAYSSTISGTDTGTASYANSAGSVAWANVTGRPSSMPASDVYAWAKASSKPSYSWGEITGKPSTFTPASHSHNYAGSSSAGGNANAAVKLATARKIGNASFDGTADITLSQMGLNVPVEITKANYLAKKKAGTLNANTYYNVIDEYDSANVINDSSVTANSAFSSTKSEKTYAKKSTLVNTTLTASKWTGSSAPYSYVLSVSGVTSSNIVEIDYASNASSAAIEAYQNAMLADGGQTTNQITIKATEKPTVDIPITIVIRNDL